MALLGDGVTPFSSLEELSARLTGAVPVVAVWDRRAASEDVPRPQRADHARSTRCWPAILVVDELTTELLQQALRAGVRDVLALTGESGALAQAVQRVAVTLDQAPGPRRCRHR